MMTIKSCISIKVVAAFVLIIMLLGISGCGSPNGRDDNAIVNKNYAKETFEVYYAAKKSDLSINESTEKWGDLKCGECTYYEFDSYSANSQVKNLFHNVMIIHNTDKAMSWFLYDDSDFSTYILYDNLDIDEHSQKHENEDITNFSMEKENSDNLILATSNDYNWSSLDGTLYFLNSENENRALSIDVIKNDDGTATIEFWCCAKTTWRILCSDSRDCKKIKENGKTLYTFSGYIYDIYENGEVISSGVEPIDKILISFDADKNEFVVASSKELAEGTSPYPIMCSGTYVYSE